MAKPIVIVYYLPQAVGPMPSIHQLNEGLRERFPDYHVLAIPSNRSTDGSCEDIRLQVFHEKDFTDIQYNELKQLITDSLK